MSAGHLKEMIISEYAFADMAAKTNIKTAFLQFLSPDAIVFDPDPVNAHQFYLSGTANHNLLKWYPAWAKISNSGTMGFSSGPWDMIPEGEETPEYFGHFISVWKKTADEWKVVLDWGVSHPRPGKRIDAVRIEPVRSEKVNSNSNLEENPEKIFAMAVLQNGWSSALNKYSTPKLRLFVESEFPIYDKIKALQIIEQLDFASKLQVTGSDYARSSDLGYMYGFAGNSPDKHVFLILWIKNNHNDWKILTAAFKPVFNK